VVTNDAALALRLRQLKDQGRPVRGTGGDDEHPVLGYNFKFTNLQAAVGMAQFEVLQPRCARQIRIQELYREHLQGVRGLRLLPFDLAGGECPQWTDAEADSRNELVTFLEQRGIGCRRFWHPLHTQAPYRLPDLKFPVSTKAGPRAFWLPSAFQLQDEDVQWVCKLVREFYHA
jgi:perosamine synthetase